MPDAAFTLDEARAHWQGIATSLALAIKAREWLEHHANTAIGAPGWIPDADRCLPCCRYAAAIIRGEHPAHVDHLRCETARVRADLLRSGHELAADVLDDEPGRDHRCGMHEEAKPC